MFSEPRFSVEVFFYFLFAMMIVSFVAFVLLNVLPSIKVEYSANDKSKLINSGKKYSSWKKFTFKEMMEQILVLV